MSIFYAKLFLIECGLDVTPVYRLYKHVQNTKYSQTCVRITALYLVVTRRVYCRNWPMRVKWAAFCNFRGPFFEKGGPPKVFEKTNVF